MTRFISICFIFITTNQIIPDSEEVKLIRNGCIECRRVTQISFNENSSFFSDSHQFARFLFLIRCYSDIGTKRITSLRTNCLNPNLDTTPHRQRFFTIQSNEQKIINRFNTRHVWDGVPNIFHFSKQWYDGTFTFIKSLFLKKQSKEICLQCGKHNEYSPPTLHNISSIEQFLFVVLGPTTKRNIQKNICRNLMPKYFDNHRSMKSYTSKLNESVSNVRLGSISKTFVVEIPLARKQVTKKRPWILFFTQVMNETCPNPSSNQQFFPSLQKMFSISEKKSENHIHSDRIPLSPKGLKSVGNFNRFIWWRYITSFSKQTCARTFKRSFLRDEENWYHWFTDIIRQQKCYSRYISSDRKVNSKDEVLLFWNMGVLRLSNLKSVNPKHQPKKELKYLSKEFWYYQFPRSLQLTTPYPNINKKSFRKTVSKISKPSRSKLQTSLVGEQFSWSIKNEKTQMDGTLSNLFLKRRSSPAKLSSTHVISNPVERSNETTNTILPSTSLMKNVSKSDSNQLYIMNGRKNVPEKVIVTGYKEINGDNLPPEEIEDSIPMLTRQEASLHDDTMANANATKFVSHIALKELLVKNPATVSVGRKKFLNVWKNRHYGGGVSNSFVLFIAFSYIMLSMRQVFSMSNDKKKPSLSSLQTSADSYEMEWVVAIVEVSSYPHIQPNVIF